MRDLVTVDTRTARARIALAACIVAALALGWFGIRWQLGDMIASLTKPGDPEAVDAADAAISLAPSDPIASWLRASSDTGSEPNLSMYENAVRLSPYDYRLHIELGRAYEQAERPADAEKELKAAVALAPSYAYPHWQLGNLFLRQDRPDEAFAELKKAASNNHTYREQVFSLAWDYFGKDTARVQELAPDTPDAKAALALFFAARGRAGEALLVWDSLNGDQKAQHSQYATLMAQGLYSQRCFPQALEFYRQLGVQTDAQPGAVTNPGFERTILTPAEAPFGWQIVRNDPKVEITADGATKHGGSRSLRVAFRNYTKPDFNNVFQVVAVEPRKNYHLTFWLLTENLKSSSTPLLQVINANDEKLLAVSKAFPSGSNDWQQFTLEFRAPENCSGIRLQTSRPPCDQCPMVGTFWYDDFELAAF